MVTCLSERSQEHTCAALPQYCAYSVAEIRRLFSAGMRTTHLLEWGSFEGSGQTLQGCVHRTGEHARLVNTVDLESESHLCINVHGQTVES